MAEDVFPIIDQCIDAFTNEKDGAIVTIKKITDPASNKKHYYGTYEDLKHSFEELYAILHTMEDAKLKDEDAEKIVDKLEELIAAEKPLFDHFYTYADDAKNDDEKILYPWDNTEPDRDDGRIWYRPGFIDDLFKEPHNLAWANAGDYLYNNFPSIQKRVWKVISQFESYEWTNKDLWWQPPEAYEGSDNE